MINRISLILFFIFIAFFVSFGNTTIWYVSDAHSDSAGSIDGLSWDTAFGNIQQALERSENGDQIWISAGKYYPTQTLDRTISFVIKEGVDLYGGFKGNETDISQRNLFDNRTYLSGDIGILDFDEDNTYNVIRAISVNIPTIVDGFVIVNGQATDPEPHERGGGAFLKNAIIEFVNCTFSDNKASFGGGVYTLGGSQAFINNCRFENNQATYAGGAIYNFLNCNVKVDKTIFYENTADILFAGAFYSFQSHMEIYNSIGLNNESQIAPLYYGTNYSTLVIVNSNFLNFASAVSHGLSLNNGSDLTIINSLIWIDQSNNMSILPYYDENSHLQTITSYVFWEDNLGVDEIKEWLLSDQTKATLEESIQVGGVLSDYTLLVHPLMIDRGTDSIVTSTDFLNNNRFIGSQVDIGFIEVQDIVSSDLKVLQNRSFYTFPNPAFSEYIYISSPYHLSDYELYAVDGSLVTTGSLNQNDANIYSIENIGSLKSGLYTIVLNTRNTIFSTQFFKSKE